MWGRIFQTEVPASTRPRGGSRFGVSEEETDSEGVWSRGPEEQNGQRVVCGEDRCQTLEAGRPHGNVNFILSPPKTIRGFPARWWRDQMCILNHFTSCSVGRGHGGRIRSSETGSELLAIVHVRDDDGLKSGGG